jgi:hypothetical protein
LSFFKSLFGLGGNRVGGTAAKTKQIEYKGFIIEARPYQEGGRYQTAGLITKDVNGIRKVHKFIRADSFTAFDEAADFALAKGRRIVDEQGDRMFGETAGETAGAGRQGI